MLDKIAKRGIKTFLLISLAMLSACASHPVMKTVDYVDLNRFMGDWYVIANIPTFIETKAYNALEQYELDDKGRIATTFSFNQGGFDGERKTYRPKGFVKSNPSNAEWGMQFIWPIKADYRIVYLNEAYDQVIIGRNARDYVWVMARQPSIDEADYDKLVLEVERLGYDIAKLRKVPQQPLDQRL